MLDFVKKHIALEPIQYHVGDDAVLAPPNRWKQAMALFALAVGLLLLSPFLLVALAMNLVFLAGLALVELERFFHAHTRSRVRRRAQEDHGLHIVRHGPCPTDSM